VQLGDHAILVVQQAQAAGELAELVVVEGIDGLELAVEGEEEA